MKRPPPPVGEPYGIPLNAIPLSNTRPRTLPAFVSTTGSVWPRATTAPLRSPAAVLVLRNDRRFMSSPSLSLRQLRSHQSRSAHHRFHLSESHFPREILHPAI